MRPPPQSVQKLQVAQTDPNGRSSASAGPERGVYESSSFGYTENPLPAKLAARRVTARTDSSAVGHVSNVPGTLETCPTSFSLLCGGELLQAIL